MAATSEGASVIPDFAKPDSIVLARNIGPIAKTSCGSRRYGFLRQAQPTDADASTSSKVGSLHEAAASSVLSSSPVPCGRKDRGSFRRPVEAGVIILAFCGLHERAAHCIKRRPMIQLQPACPALARPARPRQSPARSDSTISPDALSSFLDGPLSSPMPPRNACRPSRSGRAARRACAPPPRAPASARVA